MHRIAILASGTGTNAQQIIEYFSDDPDVKIVGVFSDRANAPVLEKARQAGVEAISFSRDDFYQNGRVAELLRSFRTDLVVLAGFLWLIPESLLEEYPGRIVNIHPALLPKFGGKGMYGMRVHQAVKDAGEAETGITIHLIDHEYDKGRILFQASFPVLPDDTPDTVAQKIHVLEHRHFPEQIEKYLQQL